MIVDFLKMSACGNDYVLVCDASLPFETVAKLMCTRRFSVGGDGLLVVLSAQNQQNNARMRMFNPDGSESEMCGNGVRCVGRFVLENHRKYGLKGENRTVLIETASGVKKVCCRDDTLFTEMGQPKVMETLTISADDRVFSVVPVNVGNPHAVVLLSESEFMENNTFLHYAPIIEKNHTFPEKTNVEFAYVSDKNKINAKFWERGAGETLSCGTGSCAVFAAARSLGLVENSASVVGHGGVLEVTENEHGMTLGGEAKIVFSGRITLDL